MKLVVVVHLAAIYNADDIDARNPTDTTAIKFNDTKLKTRHD